MKSGTHTNKNKNTYSKFVTRKTTSISARKGTFKEIHPR